VSVICIGLSGFSGWRAIKCVVVIVAVD